MPAHADYWKWAEIHLKNNTAPVAPAVPYVMDRCKGGILTGLNTLPYCTTSLFDPQSSGWPNGGGPAAGTCPSSAGVACPFWIVTGNGAPDLTFTGPQVSSIPINQGDMVGIWIQKNTAYYCHSIRVVGPTPTQVQQNFPISPATFEVKFINLQ